MTQSYLQHRCRHAPTASRADLLRPVAIGVGMEPWFRPFLQMHGHHRLGHPVCDRGHAEQTDPAAVRLRYLDALHRGREVRPRATSGSRSCTDCSSDRTRTPPGSARPLPGHPCWPQPACTPPTPCCLGMSNGLTCDVGMFPRFLPGRMPRLIESNIPDEPAPWLHPHPSEQGLHSYYGPVRRRAPHRYSVPSVSASARSLSRPGG